MPYKRRKSRFPKYNRKRIFRVPRNMMGGETKYVKVGISSMALDSGNYREDITEKIVNGTNNF